MTKLERVGIFVYLHYNREARKLNKFGDFHYHSKQGRYVLLYVNREDLGEMLKQLYQLKFVKDVRVSHLDDIDRNFVGNLNH